ncbi:hypothetical protein SAMN05421638_1762 [Kaistella treverensis]|uniref:Uncharacterized protein n=1 Tax=Kaistella treverensis TaxID=631455 RepID=A0A1I3MS95_9FLAO|nr:hypothetical protein SAMN05421638_1762 [Kaistella treverensis]
MLARQSFFTTLKTLTLASLAPLKKFAAKTDSFFISEELKKTPK